MFFTKREGRTGRISSRGLTLDAYKNDRGADILPVRSRASLVNKRFLYDLRELSICFINATFGKKKKK